MLVSVLLPTRARVDLVQRSVQSLLDTASNPSRIEILVAYDPDDTASQEYFNSDNWKEFISSYKSNAQAFETAPWGYSALNKYYNFLGQQSQGQWLLIWNDDTLMKSTGWDDHIADNKEFVGMLHMTCENYRPKFALFPLINRAWLDVFGYIGENPVDSWIHHVSMEAEAIRRIEPIVYHDRYDMTGNNYDATYANRNTGEIKKIYKSAEMRQLRHQWAQQLIAYRSKL
jgi:hypothetical protein